MEFQTSKRDLSLIWDQLNRPLLQKAGAGSRIAHHSILKDGWAMDVDVQDLLVETDDRADSVCRSQGFDFILAPLGLHYFARFRGPVPTPRELDGHKAMRAADIAVYLMEVERLGFSVDPEPLVAGLLPVLTDQRYLTNSEVSVMWYKSQRHKLGSVFVRVPDTSPTSATTIVTASGYRITALCEEGYPVTLRADPPRQKNKRELELWKSAFCRSSIRG